MQLATKGFELELLKMPKMAEGKTAKPSDIEKLITVQTSVHAAIVGDRLFNKQFTSLTYFDYLNMQVQFASKLLTDENDIKFVELMVLTIKIAANVVPFFASSKFAQ